MSQLDDQPAPWVAGGMHEATHHVRRLMQLNYLLEFLMRREMDVNETDFDAMQHLMRERSMSPSELAAALHMTPAAATTVIDRLVMAGHARRTPHASDRRRYLVEPTVESARAAMAQLIPMIRETDEALRGRSEHEQRVITDYLGVVIGAMERRIDEFHQAHAHREDMEVPTEDVHTQEQAAESN